MAALTGGSTRCGNYGDPTIAMFTCDVNHKVRLHPTAVIATGAVILSDISARCRSFGGMRLEHVLIQTTLLNEALATHTADMRQLSGVFLHVVVHSVLACFSHATMGAYKSTGGIANVDSLGSSLGDLRISYCVGGGSYNGHRIKL